MPNVKRILLRSSGTRNMLAMLASRKPFELDWVATTTGGLLAGRTVGLGGDRQPPRGQRRGGGGRGGGGGWDRQPPRRQRRGGGARRRLAVGVLVAPSGRTTATER